MRATFVVTVLVLCGLALLPGLSQASHLCDPYPIGRCGAFDREDLVFCYLPGKPEGVYIGATERTNILAVGTNGASVPGVGSISTLALLAPILPFLPIVPGVFDLAYMNLTPLQKFLADPMEAPLPTRSVYRESNDSPGLQLVNHRCANFIWFAECEPAQWMFFNPSSIRSPDEKLV